MSNKVIKVQLTEQSIDNAIKELEDYKKWLKEKTQEFVKALADEGMQISRAKFRSATYDGTNDVSVSVESRGENKAAVVAIQTNWKALVKQWNLLTKQVISRFLHLYRRESLKSEMQ